MLGCLGCSLPLLACHVEKNRYQCFLEVWNTKVFTHLRVCIYYFLASFSVVRVSHDDEAQPLSLFFHENGVAGVYGVTTVQWLPRMLYLHIEHVGELPYIYEYMSEWLSVACNFMSIFYKK